MCASFHSFRVRKLTGKPAFLTIADREFKARRIQNAHARSFSPFATKSNAFRTHSEVVSLERRMALAISQLHGCNSKHVESIAVQEAFKGKTIWSGDVEISDLIGHPKAKRCCGWSYGEPEKFTTILELPPVTDAQSAVKVGVSCQIKRARGQ